MKRIKKVKRTFLKSVAVISLLFLFFSLIPDATAAEGLKLEKIGTDQVYFTHNGKPLLSFGGLSDFIFYADQDAYDYKLWADWAAEHGINHVRAYPPLSFKHIEKFTEENGGSLDNILFPYKETEPGSRQFDLSQFDERYWRRFRRQCEYLQSKGIIIHLLMWNGWQLRASDTPGQDKSEIDWEGHFFNPDNNINSFTDHLGGDLENRYKIYHCVADKHTELADAQKAWFNKLIETTIDLDNVYYDLVHEIKEHYREWSRVRPWIEDMSLTLREHSRSLQPGKQIILGMEAGGLSEAERDWIFSRPYFDLLIYGKKHTIDNAKQWRIKYKKPYIPQESWDDNGQKYSYIHPEQRIDTRKYMWKFMMAKCQQMDLYMKPRIGFSSENLPEFPHDYNPNGRNQFEDDANVLRAFWDSLRDYPKLWFNGNIESGPGNHKYVLSSSDEAVIYCSSATGKTSVRFESQLLSVKNLSLPDGKYSADIIKPDTGIIDSFALMVKDGEISIQLPVFVDDIAMHIYRKDNSASQPESGGFKARIAIEPDGDGIKIQAYCLNNTSEDAVLRYRMISKKAGRAGTSQSSQSGTFKIAAGQEQSLSKLSLGVSAADQYEIELKVFKDRELVAQDSVSYPE